MIDERAEQARQAAQAGRIGRAMPAAPAPARAAPAATPLASWCFDGELRRYQADVLDRVPVVPGDPLHVVAPPGSGKTLLGLLLAARRGTRTLVLAPTATIRAQWARTAAALDGADGGVSDDSRALGDVTALTYQMLSVLETDSPLTELAVEAWTRELVAGGRDEEAAARWIDELRSSNPDEHRAGVARRSRAMRRELAREDPELLARALHPNARDLVDRLVAHGVETVVLDECHHLLDHWALVVAYLASRIREAGGEPLLVGLTATLPSSDDRESYDLYTSLLGEVDYEVPTPAVVKEGALAPYRDHVWFVEPTADELAFLRGHEEQLVALVRDSLATPDGVSWLEHQLRGPAGDGDGDGDESATDEQQVAAAFAADFPVAESAARMLFDLRPDHRLVPLLHEAARRAPDTEQSIRLLARWGLDRVLPDPARVDDWRRMKRVLVDLGYTLTDRGVRRARDPIDTLLASSAAKDAAVGDLLRLELDQPTGPLVKAVVVTDHAVHGNKQGADGPPAGALRTFDAVVADPTASLLRPVLVTAQHLRVAARDLDVVVPALGAALGRAADDPLPIEHVPERLPASADVRQLDTAGHGSAAVVAAVSRLLTDGTVRLVVGTRGLLGEGWDCPAVNTLIDLTAVATSSATQQLRGRTLRLDPAWPDKVAHNWTVTAVLPATTRLDAAPDVSRLERKHSRLWGLLRSDDTEVVRGLETALTGDQRRQLGRIVGKVRPATTVADLNGAVEAALPSRDETRRAWRVGEPYADRESVVAVVDPPGRVPFRSGPTLEFMLVVVALLGVGVLLQLVDLLVRAWSLGAAPGVVASVLAAGVVVWAVRPVWRQLVLSGRQLFSTRDAHRRVARVVIDGLHRAGRVPAYGEGDLSVVAVPGPLGTTGSFEIAVTGGSVDDQRTVAAAIAELFGPVGSPRFLLEAERGETSDAWRRPLLAVVLRLHRLFSRRTRHVPVPTQIGRRRADAEAFAADWSRTVGPCRLHEIDSPDDLVRVSRARRAAEGTPRGPFVRDQWS
jgi:superfamily II DNA or RNA helicase